MSLSPHCEQAGQESGGELCEFFKFRPFLQSKSVNNVCKLLQLLGDFVPRPPTGASPLDSTGGLYVFQTPGQGYSLK